MEAGSSSFKKLKFGKLKVVRQHLLQRYEHQPFVSCLAGFYSCQWKRYQRRRAEPGKCCCKMRECMFFPLLVGAFFLSLVFLYMCGEAKNDYNNFDWYNYETLGFWFLWSLVLLSAAALLFTYITLLLIGTLIVLSCSVTALFVLSILWGDQWETVRLSLQITAPYLHVGAIAIMVLLSWPVAFHAIRADRKDIQVIIVGPYLAILLFLFLIPLGMYSPCIRQMGTLGPKPELIGHRGAPMLAPENTEMSFQKTIEHGGAGLETDVTISYDGVPFLMHDRNLRRTTNIKEAYPNYVTENAAFFSWDTLQKLNAGKWFFKDKPFSPVLVLSKADQHWAMNQTIYKLSDFLRLAERHNKYVIFDLYRPPDKHPYRNSWVNRTLEVIFESGIRPHLVLWLENSMRSFVHSAAPGFQQTMGRKAPVEDLLMSNIVKLNLAYKEMSSEDIRLTSAELWSMNDYLTPMVALPQTSVKYAEANITTNLYVINEPWLFSLAWCSGAHSVTTNTVHILKNLNQPLFLMTPKQYNIMWILTDLTSMLLISLIFALHWWRERSFSCCAKDDDPMLENGTYNKFKTELNNMPNVAV